jgi:hypothetical protein
MKSLKKTYFLMNSIIRSSRINIVNKCKIVFLFLVFEFIQKLTDEINFLSIDNSNLLKQLTELEFSQFEKGF